ncbi:MAG: hypothetical protein FWG66_03470 [Spirochaetes bacterium]|nr:hypothetical protein [Spirochaetota bacterium]
MKKIMFLAALLASAVVSGFSQPAQWNVNNNSTWITAVNGIRGGGNNMQHIINITGTFPVIPTPAVENTFGTVTGITVTITGNGTISPSSNGSLLRIGSGQTVVVDGNLTLQGLRENNARVVVVGSGGTFSLVGNTTVSGNSRDWEADIFNHPYNAGGGVLVTGGYFSMAGNARVSENSAWSAGGGVLVMSETFIMSGNAMVSRNHASTYTDAWSGSGHGGGVAVHGGTFEMRGGTVSENSANGWGGGVYGSFTMLGGTISGNSSYVMGGGVFIPEGRLLTKTGGIIHGSNESSVGLRNIAGFGAGGGRGGDAIFYGRGREWDANSRWRNATAGSDMNTGFFGFWLNENENEIEEWW